MCLKIEVKLHKCYVFLGAVPTTPVGHFGFVFEENHVIFVTSSCSKSSVFKPFFRPHEKREASVLKFLRFEERHFS